MKNIINPLTRLKTVEKDVSIVEDQIDNLYGEIYNIKAKPNFSKILNNFLVVLMIIWISINLYSLLKKKK